MTRGKDQLRALIVTLDQLAADLMLAAANAQLAGEQAWDFLAELERQESEARSGDDASEPDPQEPDRDAL